jgi:hypothetical protein
MEVFLKEHSDGLGANEENEFTEEKSFRTRT